MKFYGEVGYGNTVEDPPSSGVRKDVITENSYYGDVLKNTRQTSQGETLNNDISVGTSISIVAADDFAGKNFFAIRYVRWSGILWNVSDVEVQGPRLIMQLGGVYNGPTAETTGSTSDTGS